MLLYDRTLEDVLFIPLFHGAKRYFRINKA